MEIVPLHSGLGGRKRLSEKQKQTKSKTKTKHETTTKNFKVNGSVLQMLLLILQQCSKFSVR